jgi:hypothetical protein
MYENILNISYMGVNILKNSISAHKIQKCIDKSQIVKTILEPDVIVLSGIKELDNVLGGFKAGEITFVDGDSDLISIIPNQICVNTYRTFGSDILYLDGGMCADPYKIAKYARMMELDQKETLEHVHICRAFTVYQISTLVHNMLEPSIKRYNPRTLIIGKMPILYLDSDVKTKEAKTLMMNNLEKIRELTKKYNLITVFTNIDKRMISNRRNIRKMIYSNVDEIVKMRQNEHSINIELIKEQKQATIINIADGQLQLHEFGLVISNG